MPVVETQMIAQPPMLSYAHLLRQNHDLIAQNKGDTHEAEVLAEQMDKPWSALTAKEQRRMRGLSTDLYALREGGPKRIEMTPDQLAAWQRAAREAYMQSQLGDVDAVLDFLRQPVPSNLPRHFVPFLQARSWEKLGDLETALVFMKEAERHDPHLMVLTLTLLQKLGQAEDAVMYGERIIARAGSTPEELYLAACALLVPTRSLSEREAAPQLHRIIHVLERAQAACAALPPQKWENPNLDSCIAFALGLCYERTGDDTPAIRTYSSALTRNPRDSELLVARGLALYHQNQKMREALEDFLNAVRFGTRLIWPWYILARHSLVEGAHGEALRLALQAADRKGPSEVLADVYETIAIAQSRLGQPHERVLANFEKALELSPENLRIRQNYKIASSQQAHTGTVRDWRRDLRTDRVNLGTVWECQNQEVTSRLTIAGEQREARISDGLLAG